MMARMAIETGVPEQSALSPLAEAADFHDSFAIPLADPSMTPRQVFDLVTSVTPSWFNGLLHLRDMLVRPFGIKTVGSFSQTLGKMSPDRMAIFQLFFETENEVIGGLDDSHLDVRIAVTNTRNGLETYATFTSMVWNHGRFGRFYLAAIMPVHRMIVPHMMNKAARANLI